MNWLPVTPAAKEGTKALHEGSNIKLISEKYEICEWLEEIALAKNLLIDKNSIN